MRLDRLRLSLFLVPLLILGIVTPVAAQEQPEQDRGPGNFVHPPGTETVPLGQLGGVIRAGSGPVPLLLIPGASFEADVWEPFMERNADRYTMLAVTPPGNGDTAPPPMPADPEDFTNHAWTDAFVSAVAELVVAEGLDRPVIVGHHLLGDHYALRLALEYPDLFRGVVVVAGVPSRPSGEGTIEDQIAAVEGRWKPFFRDVTWERWKQGTYPAERFSNDPEHGESLSERQLSTPLSTQLRYFLEYLTTNVALELPELRLPLLVISQTPDFEGQLEGFAEANAEQAGGIEQARETIREQLIANFGSLEEAEIAMARQWEPFLDRVPRMRLEYVDDTGLFIMDDRPERFDEALHEFATGLGE